MKATDARWYRRVWQTLPTQSFRNIAYLLFCFDRYNRNDTGARYTGNIERLSLAHKKEGNCYSTFNILPLIISDSGYELFIYLILETIFSHWDLKLKPFTTWTRLQGHLFFIFWLEDLLFHLIVTKTTIQLLGVRLELVSLVAVRVLIGILCQVTLINTNTNY